MRDEEDDDVSLRDRELDLQAVARALRQIADCVEAMPIHEAHEALPLFYTARELVKRAQRVFERPFRD